MKMDKHKVEELNQEEGSFFEKGLVDHFQILLHNESNIIANDLLLVQRVLSFLQVVNKSLLDVRNSLFVVFVVDIYELFGVALWQLVDVGIVNQLLAEEGLWEKWIFSTYDYKFADFRKVSNVIK